MQHEPGPATTENISNTLLLIFAGPIAENIFLHGMIGDEVSGTDANHVTELLALEPSFNRDKLRRDARKLVVEHWQEIKAVAAELMIVGSGKSVTHVSGTKCHLCLGPLTRC